MIATTITPAGAPVKRPPPRAVKFAARRATVGAAGLRFVGELDALFPEIDPERFLATFDYVALQELQVKKLVLDRHCELPWPNTDDPMCLAAWFRDNEIKIFAQEFLGTRRSYRWFGLYRLILAQQNEVH